MQGVDGPSVVVGDEVVHHGIETIDDLDRLGRQGSVPCQRCDQRRRVVRFTPDLLRDSTQLRERARLHAWSSGKDRERLAQGLQIAHAASIRLGDPLARRPAALPSRS